MTGYLGLRVVFLWRMCNIPWSGFQ